MHLASGYGKVTKKEKDVERKFRSAILKGGEVEAWLVK
jgi:hypothetical protein